MKKVALFGTVNSNFRQKIKEALKDIYIIIDPIVDNDLYERDREKYENDNRLYRLEADYVVYTLTPCMRGFYSVAELVDDVNNRDDVILCYLKEDMDKEGNTVKWTKEQLWSLLNLIKLLSIRSLQHKCMVIEGLDNLIKHFKLKEGIAG